MGKLAQTSLVFLLLAALWLGGLYWFTRTIAAMPVTSPAGVTENADAIVILTGGSNRLQAGIDLFRQGHGKKVFISGVYRGVEVRELLDLWKGVDTGDMNCCVVLGFDADDTIGNARETRAWLDQEGYASIYLVTSHYHILRAGIEFEIAAPALRIIPHPVAPDGFDMRDWWREGNMRGLIIREYTKYLASLARHVFLYRSPS